MASPHGEAATKRFQDLELIVIESVDELLVDVTAHILSGCGFAGFAPKHRVLDVRRVALTEWI